MLLLVGLATAPEARAGEPPEAAIHAAIDPRLAGVALTELEAPAASALDAWIRAHDPAGFGEIAEIVLVSVEDDGSASCSGAEVIVDVVGRARPLGRRARGPRRARARREAPPEVARVAVTVATAPTPDRVGCCGDAGACGDDRLARLACLAEPRCAAVVGSALLGAAPVTPATARVVDRWAYADMGFAVRVSISDQVAVLEDARRGYRRVFPVGVGAIDAVRRPGQLTSLTPVSRGSRIRRATSHEALGAPKWARNLPFLSLEVPTGRRDGEGRLRTTHVKTRLAFHVHATWRFIRGYTSRGCVTMREADLQALADALFFGPDTIPVAVQIEAFADARHPHAHNADLHFALKNFGTDEEPEFRVRGNLYVTEKVAGPPPTEPLIGVPLDLEARLERERALAGAASAAEATQPN